MLTASENVAIPLEVYDDLMEAYNTLEEFNAAIMNNLRLSWDKGELVLDVDGSTDLMTLFRIKYPVAYNNRFERLLEDSKIVKEAETDAGD